jgi:hypothetical protein
MLRLFIAGKVLLILILPFEADSFRNIFLDVTHICRNKSHRKPETVAQIFKI